jgi:hypothetical protein
MVCACCCSIPGATPELVIRKQEPGQEAEEVSQQHSR